MKTLSEWLQRKPAGPKPRKPLKRTTKPRPTSPKRQRESREYSKKRKAFLASKRFCEGKRFVGVCSENFVGQAIHSCFNRPQDVHHKAGRLGGNFLNESTWLPVCRTCHDWIHAHPKEARALGLLA